MANNENLHAANKAKKDEFYTQLSDIENEYVITSHILKAKRSYVTVMIHASATSFIIFHTISNISDLRN